jgi:hypothetical protein
MRGGLIRRGHVQQGVGLEVRAHELIDAVSQVGPARAFTLQQGSPFPRFGDGNDGGKQVELVHGIGPPAHSAESAS